MCVFSSSKPKAPPKATPILPPTEAPEQGGDVEAKRKRKAAGTDDGSGFRLDLTTSTGGSGLNVPGSTSV